MTRQRKPVDDITRATTVAGGADAAGAALSLADLYIRINEEALNYLRAVMNDPKSDKERRDKAADRLLMIVNKGKTTTAKNVKSQRVEAAQAHIDGGGAKFTPARPPNGHA